MLTTALLLLVTACGGTNDPLGPVSGDGAGPVGAWVLVETSPPIDVPAAARITLTVEQDDGSLRAGGTAACNQYGGPVELAGQTWSMTEIAMTAMGCEPPLMEAEAAYLDALSGVDTWERQDATLVLRGPATNLTFELLPQVEPASFTDTTWELDGLIHGSGDDGAVSSTTAGVDPAVLRLDADGTFTLYTGCRDFAGEWSTTGDEVQFPSWGQTEDSRGVGADGGLTCDDAAETQEHEVLAVTEAGFQTAVDGQRLTLRNGEVGLTFRAAD